MLKPTIFKVLWFALIFIQKYFSKTPIHLADEMPTSEGVRQGTSSQLVSLFFTLVKSLYMLPGERTEEMKKIRKTTIASVDALYNVEFSGNIIPHTWYGTIQTEKGKPDMNAIAILSEILYWHRPRESCGDGDSGETVLEKRFASDMLQLSYGQLNKKLHLSKAQCRRAMKNLERLGVIKRHLRDLETDAGDRLNNVMFIELFSDRLLQLTFPDEAAPGAKNVTRVSNEMDEVSAFDEPGGIRKDMTNTEISTEITNKDYPSYQSELERVRDQIDYDILIEDMPADKGIIDNIVDIIVEINVSRKKTLNVNSETVAADLVKARLGSLNGEMIRTTLDRIKNSVVSVGNMKAYLITILFNTPATYEAELAMQVSRDMYAISH